MFYQHNLVSATKHVVIVTCSVYYPNRIWGLIYTLLALGHGLVRIHEATVALHNHTNKKIPAVGSGIFVRPIL